MFTQSLPCVCVVSLDGSLLLLCVCVSVQMTDDYALYMPELDLPPMPEPLKREKSQWEPTRVCSIHPPPLFARDDEAEHKEAVPCRAPTDEETPDCKCGKRAAVHEIKKDSSPNKGKFFFSCAKRREDPTVCGFWQLQGGPEWKAMEMAPTHITCDCRKQARAVTQKKVGKNQGKKFYTCAKKECGWFRWA